MIEHEQIEHLLRVNRLADASELIKRAFSQRPDDPDLHYYAARVAWSRDKHALASEHIAKTLARSPLHFPARVLRLQLLMDERSYVEAEQEIIALLRENPEDAELLSSYARLMMHTLHLDKAAALVQEALRLDPESQEARLVHVLLAVIRGDQQLARSALGELISDDPTALNVSYMLLQLLIEEGRHRQALQLGRELLRVDPSNEKLVDALVELRAATHWLALPAYPMNRWGWMGSAGVWFGAVTALNIARRSQAPWAGALAILWLCYLVYSWVYGPLLKRWIRWRGI